MFPNYVSQVYKLFIAFWKCQDTQTLFILEDIYRKFFSTVCCFFSFTFWSVNCISWVSKFNNFFLTCTENEARIIFEGFNFALYGKVISNSPILFPIFYVVCKFFKGVFKPLCQSVNCMNWDFESENISQRCPVMKVLNYIWDLVVLLFMEISICTVSTTSDFFLVYQLWEFSL